MKLSLLRLLQCPGACNDLLEVDVVREVGGEILEGRVLCSKCGGEYPIQEGILRMLPRDLQDAEPQSHEDASINHKLSEMAARDAQVDDYDKMWHLNLFGKIEIPVMHLCLGLSSEHLLLEGGCGTGRMTRDFAHRCKEQVSVDFSWESLRSCALKLRREGVRNVHLVQADLCHLPFKTEEFDRVVSCQVLEHIPSEELRELAVKELARTLKRTGNLALSAYQYSLLMKWFGEKEGSHDGGIYFYRFTREEFESLMSRHLHVDGIIGAMVYHYIARCHKV